MQLEDYFDFSDPLEIRIKGHRVWIEHVLYPYIYQSRTAEEIHRDFATLALEEVYATILYYLHNKEAVSKYMAEWIEKCRKSEEQNRREHADWYERMRQRKAEMRAEKGGKVGA